MNRAMEFPGILSQPKKVSSDNSSAGIDLTLRLGLPHNDKQNQGNQLVAENMAVQTGEMSKAGTNFSDFSSQQRIGSQEKIENNSSVLKRSCKRCGVVNTPIWRKGPDGSQTLCNACGLRCSRALKKAATVLGTNLNWNHQQSAKRTG